MTYTNENDEKLKLQQLEQQPAAAQQGGYTSKYQQQLSGVSDKILNREKFNYDVNADALYQQLKDQYVQQGQMAMMDTMGQLSALTGGYGNSYAQQAGQQAYHGYLQGLNEQIPDLYQMALNRYMQEGEDLYNQYGLLSEQEAQEYDRYRDYVADQQWNQSFEYQQGRDQVADQQWNQSFEYQQGRDQIADQQWQQSYDYQVDRDKVADSQWQAEFDEAKRQYDQAYALENGGSSGGSSRESSGGSSGGGGYDNQGYSASVVKQAQDFVGASADGKWGPNSAAAAKAMGYGSLADVIAAMGGGSSSSGGSAQGSGLQVDTRSIIDLGYGPISENTLNQLVESGKVEEYEENGLIRFRNSLGG